MIGFFKESNGDLSFMRLLSFMVAVAAMVLGFMAVYYDSKISESLAVTFLGYAFGGKVIQKALEERTFSKNTDNENH